MGPNGQKNSRPGSASQPPGTPAAGLTPLSLIPGLEGGVPHKCGLGAWRPEGLGLTPPHPPLTGWE